MPVVAYGDFGQVQALHPTLLAITKGPYWGTWPTAWRSGLAASIQPPAPGAWTPPERLGVVVNNLASMVKRMEQMRRSIESTSLRAMGLAVAVDYRTKPPTVTYTKVA